MFLFVLLLLTVWLYMQTNILAPSKTFFFFLAYIHAFFSKRQQNAYLIIFQQQITTTRNWYFKRATKSRLMADFESESADVKETLAQVQGERNLFQGNMENIMEYLQT